MSMNGAADALQEHLLVEDISLIIYCREVFPSDVIAACDAIMFK